MPRVRTVSTIFIIDMCYFLERNNLRLKLFFFPFKFLLMWFDNLINQNCSWKKKLLLHFVQLIFFPDFCCADSRVRSMPVLPAVSDQLDPLSVVGNQGGVLPILRRSPSRPPGEWRRGTDTDGCGLSPPRGTRRVWTLWKSCRKIQLSRMCSTCQ